MFLNFDQNNIKMYLDLNNSSMEVNMQIKSIILPTGTMGSFLKHFIIIKYFPLKKKNWAKALQGWHGYQT